MSKRIGYIRVSTTDQNPDRQLDGVPLDRRFIDYASGTTTNRPQLKAMLDYARDDDHIIVHSMDRLARNIKDLRNIVDDLTIRGVKISFAKESVTFDNKKCAMSNLLLMLLGSIAEFEHSLIRERQLEGIAIAKSKGKYKGRKRKIDIEKTDWIKSQLLTRKPKNRIAKELGVSRMTLHRYVKLIGIEYES